MQHHLKLFLDYLSIERNYSKNTVDAYRSDILKLISFLLILQVSHFTDVTYDHVVNLLNELRRQNLSFVSIRRAIHAFRSFFKFLLKEGILQRNIMILIELPKIWQKTPTVLSYSEICQLLELPCKKTLKGRRDRALLELLYGSGLRVSEACCLKVKDICFDTMFAKVMGKGQRERLVPINNPTKNALILYWMKDRYKRKLKKGFAITSITMCTALENPLDRIMVFRIVKEYAKKLGTTKRVYTHSLRHSFATHLMDGGADIRVVQELLGHVHIGSTGQYITLSSSKIANNFTRYHLRN